MEKDISLFSRDYKTAALELTIAVADMTKALDTPEFNDAFWRVQQASARLKRLRAAIERSANSKMDPSNSLVSA